MPAKAQRTKGNLKPSSSSQAGQLLAQSGHSAVGFIGFSTQPAYVPASEIFDDADTSLDADFRLALRKLSKKDTVTKIKALQEFSFLCGSKNDECVKAVVAFWPRIYNKVAIDVDHKVRELSQKALLALAERVGKHLSPHLRSIMGIWMICMCDSYPTVASAANLAFSSIFPPVKQTAALRFCKTECAECFLNHIIKQTPQTLSDPLTTSEEDMTAKYHRVVSSSFHAMRKLLTALLDAPADLDSMASHLNSLLASPAFWKHAKSSVPLVNGGVMSILSAICQHCPSVSGAFVNKIAPLVFSFVDSKDPILVSYGWEALLSLINTHEDCWQHVNWQKAIWPKLKTVLESGCGGHAEVVAPCLLPLLSKLPQKNLNPFFDAFRLGLNQESVINSPSAMSSLVKALMECVHYCVKTNGQDRAALQGLIQDQILVVVEASLTDTKMALTRSPLYSLLPPVLASLENNHSDIEEEFWKELSIFTRHYLLSLLSPSPESGSEGTASVDSYSKSQSVSPFFSRLWHLARGLLFQQTHPGNGKKQKVVFVREESNDKDEIKSEKKSISRNTETFISDVLLTSFYLTTEYQALEYFKLFKDYATLHIPVDAARRLNNSEDSLKVELCEELQSKLAKPNSIAEDKDIESRLQELCQIGCSSNSNEFMTFVYKALLKLLLYEQQRPDPNLVFTEELFMSCFAFLPYFDEDDAVKLLSVLSQALSSLAIVCQLIENLIRCVQTIPACAKALDMSVINSKIAQIASGASDVGGRTSGGRGGDDGGDGSIWRMLLAFVSQLGEGVCVSNTGVDAVINSCVMTLDHHRQKRIELSPVPLSGLLSVLQTLLEKSLVKGHPKFSELISSLIHTFLGSSALNAECSTKIEAALTAGFKLIVTDLPAESIRLHEVCKCIRTWVRSKVKTFDHLVLVEKTVGLLVASMPSANDDEDAGKESSDAKPDSETGSGSLLDNLLCTDPIQVEELRDTLHLLYMKGVLFRADPPSRLAGARYMSLKSFGFLALYNLRTLKAVLGVHSTTYTENREDRVIHSLSPREMECLLGLTLFLFQLDEAGQTNKMENVTELTDVKEELQNDVGKILSLMTGRQVQALVDLAIQSSESSTLAVALGLEKCFGNLLQSEKDLHSKRSISHGVHLLQKRFIHRCVSEELEAKRISSMLKDKATWSSEDVLPVYDAVRSRLMKAEEVDLPRVSECIFGFVRLMSMCEAVSQKNLASFFTKTSEITLWLKGKGIHLLTGSDVEETTSSSSSNVESVLQYNRCVALSLLALPAYQLEDYWDLTLCTLVEWIQFLSEATIGKSSSLELQTLMASVCLLASFVARTFHTAPVIEDLAAECDRPSVAIHQKTKTEWEEFFSEGVFSPMLSQFVSCATESLTSSGSRAWLGVIEQMASGLILCPAKLLLAHEFPARLTMTDKSGIHDDLKTLLNHVCPLLNARLWRVQISAFNLLGCVMEQVATQEAASDEGTKGGTEDEEEEEEARSPPEALSVLVEAAAVSLDSVLMTEDIEDVVAMTIGSPEHSLAVGYLLGWGLQLRLFKCASNELRAKYAQFFKSHDSVSHLCDHLFRLMPSHPASSMLDFQLALDGTDEVSVGLLGSLAIRLYGQCLEVLPALVRAWWVDQNRKASNFVDRFTTQYISNGLCVKQLTSSEMTTASIEDITIRPRPAAREVSAVYEMAEVTVNMTIKLPDNYPLGKVEVFCDKRVGVSQAQWDKWLLQLNIFLQHQNGSIVEGLKLWKRNIDKKFEGIDDCMICYSVIHGTTFQLPRLTCRTCRKKFHSACLYKWFNTSQKSSCPMCRNLF